MRAVLRVPSRLPSPRSWPRWRLLRYASLIILSVYRLEYAYAALIFHSTFMTIYAGILSLVLLIPLIMQSALVGPATT
jgi:hypothetical protein